MAKTKVKPVGDMTPDELQLQLRELKQEALNLRLQKAVGQLENPARIQQVRRDTARVLTAMNAAKSA